MNSLRERSIVVVEDSPEDYAAFRRAFRKCEPDVPLVHFKNGEDCLQELRSKDRRLSPVVVVLDLNLPVLGGYEILQEIRDDLDLKSIPIVVLTTSSNPRDVKACYELGIAGYMLKDGDFADFSQKVRRLSEYWLHAVYLP